MLTWQKKNGEWGLNGVPEEELKKVCNQLMNNKKKGGAKW